MTTLKTLKDICHPSMQQDGRFTDIVLYSPNELRSEAIKWIKYLEQSSNELMMRNNYCSDEAYAATSGVVNLKKIEEEQIIRNRIEYFARIEWIKYFFNISESDLK